MSAKERIFTIGIVDEDEGDRLQEFLSDNHVFVDTGQEDATKEKTVSVTPTGSETGPIESHGVLEIGLVEGETPALKLTLVTEYKTGENTVYTEKTVDCSEGSTINIL